MKTVSITYYLYHELDDFAKKIAIENFRKSSAYQYAYAWSDEKVVEVIIKNEYHFTYSGELYGV